MTLISALINNGYPILVSDRAISNPAIMTSVLSPMTNEEVVRPTPVCEFNIKTIIIQGRICIGFSGNVPSIEQKVSEIQDFFLHRQVTWENLAVLLDSAESQQQCSVIYIYADEQAESFRILRTGQWLIDTSLTSVDVLSSGSGAAAWNAYFIRTYPYLDDGEWSTLFWRQSVLQSCMNFLANERVTARTLLDGWGGGFDLVYFEEGAFRRLENLAFAFYVTDISSSHKALVPLSVIHQKYVDGKAIITHFQKEGTKIYSIAEFNDKTPNEDHHSDCHAREIISCVHILDGGQHLKSLSVLFWDTNPSAEPAFSTTRRNGEYGILFREIYMEKLKEAVDNALT